MGKSLNESALIDGNTLHAQLDLLRSGVENCEQEAKKLLKMESSSQNYAQEIFSLKQKKLELQTQILFYEKALGKLEFEQLGEEE